MAIAFVYSFVLNINMASNEVKPNIACIAHICMRMTIFFLHLQNMYTLNTSRLTITHFMTQNRHHIYTQTFRKTRPALFQGPGTLSVQGML